MDDEQITLLKPGSIFIDDKLNICATITNIDNESIYKSQSQSRNDSKSQSTQKGTLSPSYKI